MREPQQVEWTMTTTTLFLCLIQTIMNNKPKKRIPMNNKIVLCLHNEVYVIHCESVLYMQADDHYTHIVCMSGARFMVPFGLSELEKRLDTVMTDDKFLIRVGRKYIINMRHVFHVNTVKQVAVLADSNGNNYSVSLPKPILRNIIERLSGSE